MTCITCEKTIGKAGSHLYCWKHYRESKGLPIFPKHELGRLLKAMEHEREYLEVLFVYAGLENSLDFDSFIATETRITEKYHNLYREAEKIIKYMKFHCG